MLLYRRGRGGVSDFLQLKATGDHKTTLKELELLHISSKVYTHKDGFSNHLKDQGRRKCCKKVLGSRNICYTQYKVKRAFKIKLLGLHHPKNVFRVSEKNSSESFHSALFRCGGKMNKNKTGTQLFQGQLRVLFK